MRVSAFRFFLLFQPLLSAEFTGRLLLVRIEGPGPREAPDRSEGDEAWLWAGSRPAPPCFFRDACPARAA